MAQVFNNMSPAARWWGTLFFLFHGVCRMSTVLACCCENILAMVREITGWSRPRGLRRLRRGGVPAGAGPTALGNSVLSFQPFAEGSSWLDLWDFIVSNTSAPGFAAHRRVLLPTASVGLGKISGGGQRGPRPEGEELDAAPVRMARPCSDPVLLCLRIGRLQVAIRRRKSGRLFPAVQGSPGFTLARRGNSAILRAE
jgi:hypothetical protein